MVDGSYTVPYGAAPFLRSNKLKNMKVKTTVTLEREIDIHIPFFRRDLTSSCIWLFAVLDDRTVVSIFRGGERVAISNDALNKFSDNDIADKYQNWSPISEKYFLTAHADALKSLSLEPQLTT